MWRQFHSKMFLLGSSRSCRILRQRLLSETLLLAWLKASPDLKRQPLLVVLVIFYSSLPLFFFLLFGAGLIEGMAGAFVGSVAVLGVATPIEELGSERIIKFREILIASPVSPLAYAFGTALAPLLISLPGLLFFFAIGLWNRVITFHSLPIILLVLMMTWASMASLGFAISTVLPKKASSQTLSNLANLVGFALVVLPPVYYPETLLHGLSWLAILIPTSNAASLIRAYSGLLPLSATSLLLRWTLLTAFVCVSAFIAGGRSRWREC
jgi:ABC-2 type transport system permease protein